MTSVAKLGPFAKMVVFNDVNPTDKLLVYNHKIDWIDRLPVPHPEEAHPIKIEEREPLKSECEHFIKCIHTRKQPKTDGESGLRVLKILEACQESLKEDGQVYNFIKKEKKKYFIHGSSLIDENVNIGDATKIWHFSHILKNTKRSFANWCNSGYWRLLFITLQSYG